MAFCQSYYSPRTKSLQKANLAIIITKLGLSSYCESRNLENTAHLMKTFSVQVLHVQYSTTCEILDLVTGGHYCLQLRTQPDGQKYQGVWSAWSSTECIEIPPGSGE
uniref:Uncharacterized protein n=1 Tax=Sphaerodactylus townsendi TaxID=933632 RepID=A0ACB8F4X0_9SAUR